jgi:outer membrane protein assembly factor BamB
MGVEYPMLWFTAEDGYLYALNAENGNFLWKLAGSGLPGNSGVTVQVPRTVFYNCRLEPNSSKTRAVNALTGQIIWESGSHNLTTATPLVIHFLDMLIQGVAQGGRNVRAYRTTNGDNLWNISTPGTHSSCYTSGVFGAYDRLSISTKDGSVRVYNVHNQHLIWEKNLPDAREIFGFALKQQIGGEILIITTLNDIYCLKAATGELLWHVNHRGNLIDEFRRTPMPAVYGGLVIHVEDGQKLTVRRLKNGEEVWHFHLDGTVISSPALSDRCIFIGTQAGTFYSFYSCHY